MRDGSTVYARHYQTFDSVPAATSDGTAIVLPFTDMVVRTTSKARGLRKKEVFVCEERATAIDYAKMPKLARSCIALAQKAAAEGRARTDTLPRYKRLALGGEHEEAKLPLLYSVIARDGIGRYMHRYPDEHLGTLMAPKDELTADLDRPITHAKHVSSTYMVVPRQDDRVAMTTYRDTDANVFGPGETEANAFWFSGPPLAVFAEQDPRLMRRDPVSLQYEPRYVIVPTEFYQVAEAQG